VTALAQPAGPVCGLECGFMYPASAGHCAVLEPAYMYTASEPQLHLQLACCIKAQHDTGQLIDHFKASTPASSSS